MGNNNCCGCGAKKLTQENLLLRQEINTLKLINNSQSQLVEDLTRQHDEKVCEETDIESNNIDDQESKQECKEQHIKNGHQFNENNINFEKQKHSLSLDEHNIQETNKQCNLSNSESSNVDIYIAYGESFTLNKNQRQLIETSNTLQVIEKDIEEYGELIYNKKTSCLKLILYSIASRDKSVEIIRNQLDCVTDNMECERKELIFILSVQQLTLAIDYNNIKILMNDASHLCSIGVDKYMLKVSISVGLPIISTVYKLEKTFGVLMTSEEIQEIKCEYDNSMCDVDFFNSMMSYVENSIKFIKHKKKGVYDERYVLIHKGRLYWKEIENGKNSKNRSIHLTNILDVKIGKNTNALKHESLKHIEQNCCFSIISKKATLDFSTPSFDVEQVRKFTTYLNGLRMHFINQKSQLIAQSPEKRHHRQRVKNGNVIKHKNGNISAIDAI
eukprot:480859_1